MTDNYIFEKIDSHRAKAASFLKENNIPGRIVGAFLYGSQNYNLDTENSDIDIIIIFVPSIDFAIVNSPKNYEVKLKENNEHIIIKDIRNYIHELVEKTNPNAIELLYTKYSIYSADFKYFLEKREEFLLYGFAKFEQSSIGLANQYLKKNTEKSIRNFLRFYFLVKHLNNNRFDNPFYLTEDEKQATFEASKNMINEGGFTKEQIELKIKELKDEFIKIQRPNISEVYISIFYKKVKQYMINLIKSEN